MTRIAQSIILTFFLLVAAVPAWAQQAHELDAQIETLKEAARKGDDSVFQAGISRLEAIGSAEVYYKLGELYSSLPTKYYLEKPDYRRAAAFYQKVVAIRSKNVSLRNRGRKKLAELYRLGEGVERNLDTAVALLKDAIETGSGDAAYIYAGMLEDGAISDQPDIRGAEKWYRFALKKNYGPAAFALASLYRRGLIDKAEPNSLDNMMRLGIAITEKKARAGDAGAAYTLGSLYEMGEDVAADPAKALAWYKLGMEGNSADAYRGAARLYGKGVGVDRDPLKAAEFMEKAAELGSVSAALALGRSLEEGSSYFLQVKEEVALKWLERAVAVGESGAVKILANHYLYDGNTERAIALFEKSAAEGNVGSMINLYRFYSDGTIVAQNQAKAKIYLDSALAASQFTISDRMKLAELLLDPLSQSYDPEKGIAFLESAAEAGQKQAPFQLAKFYGNKRSRYYNPVKAFRWHSRAAAEGGLTSMLWVAEAATNGVGTEKDPDLARLYFAEALKRAKTQDAEVFSKIGMAYKLGHGTPQNIVEALKWFEKAANLGDAQAKLEFGRVVIWDTVPGYTPQDGLRMMDEAAATGEANAFLEIGKVLSSGLAATVNYKRAYQYFLRASEAGITEANYHLGILSLAGLGTARDPEKALAYLKRAASEGFAPASFELGVQWLTGGFGERDEQEAFKQFSRAANAGEPEAYYYVGKAYLEGWGTGRDVVKAKAALAISGETGHVPSKRLLKKLEPQA